MGATEAEDSIVINAPPQLLFDLLTDYEHLPEWQAACERTTVLDRDDNGRGHTVEFHIDVKVKKLRYVNRYDYQEPTRIAVKMLEGDLKSSETEYLFEPIDDRQTRATQRTAVDPGILVPGPVKKLLTGRMLHDQLVELKQRAESGAP